MIKTCTITDDEAVIELLAAFGIDKEFGRWTYWGLPWSDSQQVGRVRTELEKIGVQVTI